MSLQVGGSGGKDKGFGDSGAGTHHKRDRGHVEEDHGHGFGVRPTLYQVTEVYTLNVCTLVFAIAVAKLSLSISYMLCDIYLWKLRRLGYQPRTPVCLKQLLIEHRRAQVLNVCYMSSVLNPLARILQGIHPWTRAATVTCTQPTRILLNVAGEFSLHEIIFSQHEKCVKFVGFGLLYSPSPCPPLFPVVGALHATLGIVFGSCQV